MPNDHIEVLKRQLAAEILNVASQTKAWRVTRALGIDRARLSNLRRGRLERFSLEWLIDMLGTLGRRVDLTVVVIGSPRVRWAALLRQRTH